MREHLTKLQFTGADPCDTDTAWRMPVRVPAADPQTTGDPDAADSPSDASASFDDADAEEDVEMSAESKAELQKTYEEVREAAAHHVQTPPPSCLRRQKEALLKFSEAARNAMTLGSKLWDASSPT